MKKILRRFMTALIIVFVSIVLNTYVDHVNVKKIVVPDEELIDCPTSYPNTFIVIWEDPEDLDIFSYPWTGNNGIDSNVVYRST